MRVSGKRGPIGVVGSQEDTPGIVHQQKQLQSDTPLQGIDEITVPVTERHHAAAGIAFDIHGHPFVRMGVLVAAILHHGVAGGGHGLAEHDLPHVDAACAC